MHDGARRRAALPPATPSELSPTGGGITYLDPVRNPDRLQGYHPPPGSIKPMFLELHLKGMREGVIGVLCKSATSARIPRTRGFASSVEAGSAAVKESSETRAPAASHCAPHSAMIAAARSYSSA